MLAIVLGSAIFAVRMVIYGHCPGTGLAAIGTGSLHALAGGGGMLGGGILYALTFPWAAKHIPPVADIGKLTLDKLFCLPAAAVFGMLAVMAIGGFALLHQLENPRSWD